MGVTAGVIGTAFGFTGATATAVGAGTLAVGAAGAYAGVSSALAPRAPGAPPVTAMPNQQQITQAEQQTAAQQLFRTGRAATVLSQSSASPTSDKLGP